MRGRAGLLAFAAGLPGGRPARDYGRAEGQGMTAHISAYGRLVADPERRETRTGKFWATGRMAVTLPKPPGDPEEAEPPTLWLSVTAFGGKATKWTPAPSSPMFAKMDFP